MFSLEQYNALRHAAGIVDRSSRGRIRLTGQDRRSYLQGLLTNDITGLAPGQGCYAALLTPQGRMIADMNVLETGDDLVIDLPARVTAAVRDQLELFIFSEDVKVADTTASWVQVGVYGPEAGRVLSKGIARSGGLPPLDGLPLFANSRAVFAGTPVLMARCDDIGVPGFELFADASAAEWLREALHAAGAVDVDPGTVEVCRVEGGRPAFGIDMDADTIPLEAGIEDRAISFTKGCYVGQEIVIRVLHRGHGRVARRLVGLTLDASAGVPSRGDVIRAADRDIGAATSAVRSPALDRPIALGYVHRDFTEPGTAVTIAGHPAVVTTLPFVPAD